jgi:hypothetical protein
MCWSAQVSLETFITSFIQLIFLYLLDYDIKSIAIVLSFIFIQLLEYYIWTYIKNKKISRFYSFLTFILIFSQPIIILYFTEYSYLIKYYIILQFLILIISILFFNLKFNFVPTVSPSKHLVWNWTDNTIYFILFCTVYLLFFLGAIYLTKNYTMFLFSILTYLYSMYNYWNDGTLSSMWCWIANIGIYFMLFDAIRKKIYDKCL